MMAPGFQNTPPPGCSNPSFGWTCHSRGRRPEPDWAYRSAEVSSGRTVARSGWRRPPRGPALRFPCRSRSRRLPEQRVLVVDDEAPLRDFVCRNLEVRGYRVETAANGLQALAQFKRQAFDLVILDLMMPQMDGLETTRRLRQESTVPVVVLSALGEEADKVAALELGADDYLTKPFGVPELLARGKAVLRRSTWNHPSEERAAGRLERDGVVLDLDGHTLLVEGSPVDLTPIEFELLLLLMRNAGKVLTHRSLLQTVWGSEYGGEVEYLRVYVGRLRRKIETDPSRPTHLLTEHGLGYRFA